MSSNLTQIALVDFCNSLKKGGLYIIGSVLHSRFLDKYNQLSTEWISFLHRNKIKAFAQISVAPDAATQLLGYQNLLSLAGLGPMKPNTVCLPLCKLEVDRRRKRKTLDAARKLSAYDVIDGVDDDAESEPMVFDSPNLMEYGDYMELLRCILRMEKSVILTVNFEYFDFNLLVSEAIKSKFNLSPHATDFVSPLFGPQSILATESRHKNKQRRRRMVLPDNTENRWVDVWLFPERYSFGVEEMEHATNHEEVFPMLMLQFAHILAINKVCSVMM